MGSPMKDYNFICGVLVGGIAEIQGHAVCCDDDDDKNNNNNNDDDDDDNDNNNNSAGKIRIHIR